MNYQKLKRLAILICLAIVLILIISHCEIEEKGPSEQEIEQQQNVSTNDVAFDISSVEDDRFIRDYTNPTDDEKAAAYERYGQNGDKCYFDENGLNVLREDSNEYVLITNKMMEDHKRFQAIVRPPEDKIDYFEYAEEYLKVYLRNVSLKETESHLKDVKKEYDYELPIVETKVIYKGVNEHGDRVTVTYDSMNSKALFNYTFKDLEPAE